METVLSLSLLFFFCLIICHPTPIPEWFVEKKGKCRDKELQHLKQAELLERPRARPAARPARSGKLGKRLLPRPPDKQRLLQRLGFVMSEFSRNLEGGQ